MVRILLKAGADANAIDSTYTCSPFYLACANGYTEIVALLLDHPGVDVNAHGGFCRTPLLWASNWGYHEVVQLLLRDKRVDLNTTDDWGRTPLLAACGCGWAEDGRSGDKVAQLLLHHAGVDLNRADNLGRTPLHVACQKPLSHPNYCQPLAFRSNLVRALVDAGADMSVVDLEGNTALACACDHEELTLPDYIFLLGHTPAESTTEHDMLECVHKLIQKDPQALVQRDPETMLLPFMAAAGLQELDLTYAILRGEPTVLESGIS
ncbi:Ankyrin repeat [Seminavis robusta]|uniref:Ankyrin repeat n=1 Tax=Seminavis robusta TaxID=568900 RepID=A0A9N8ECI0_9STRA|nr:Ankyrin repeat [Seminavis robusta]|eukprot:Sro922_g220520.1 Ankyrin repeat (265) ;mRNA; r:14649-15443